MIQNTYLFILCLSASYCQGVFSEDLNDGETVQLLQTNRQQADRKHARGIPSVSYLKRISFDNVAKAAEYKPAEDDGEEIEIGLTDDEIKNLAPGTPDRKTNFYEIDNKCDDDGVCTGRDAECMAEYPFKEYKIDIEMWLQRLICDMYLYMTQSFIGAMVHVVLRKALSTGKVFEMLVAKGNVAYFHRQTNMRGFPLAYYARLRWAWAITNRLTQSKYYTVWMDFQNTPDDIKQPYDNDNFIRYWFTLPKIDEIVMRDGTSTFQEWINVNKRAKTQLMKAKGEPAYQPGQKQTDIQDVLISIAKKLIDSSDDNKPPTEIQIRRGAFFDEATDSNDWGWYRRNGDCFPYCAEPIDDWIAEPPNY